MFAWIALMSGGHCVVTMHHASDCRYDELSRLTRDLMRVATFAHVWSPTLINSHARSSTLSWFKFWRELMRVFALLPVMRVDESFKQAKYILKYKLCSFNSLFRSFFVLRAWWYPINSHATLVLVWPWHESWGNCRANSRLPTLINSYPGLTRA